MSFVPKNIRERIQRRKDAIKESDIENVLVNMVEQELGGLCLKLIGFDFTGFPDRTVLLPGARIYFIELKRFGEPARPRQGVIRRLLEKLGFDWRIIDNPEAIQHFKAEVQGE